ncbi:hypothetical protein J6Z39_09160 [bacterium]|nr:hypothetical protein [bacterium]MBP5435972.1 hypothetical protein [bacterium]
MWIEIFKTGTWTSSQGKTTTYNKDDLDAIVSKFDPANEPPVTVGHPETDTAPAFGWMKALKRVGEVLIGDFEFVPEFLELLKKGVYKNRSIGLRNGAIAHVAFLGGAAPAVKGLESIKFSADEAETAYYETNLEKENEMEKEAQERIAQLEAENAKMKADFAASQKEIESMKAEKAKMETEKREGEVDAFCDSLVKNGQLTPAVADSVKATMHGLCADEKNFEKGGVIDQMKAMYSGLPKMEHLNPDMASKKNAKGGKDEVPADYYGMPVDPDSALLHQKAEKIQKEEKISYSEAVVKAMKMKEA